MSLYGKHVFFGYRAWPWSTKMAAQVAPNNNIIEDFDLNL